MGTVDEERAVTSKMARICFVCISLRSGGTERVVSTLANRFSGKHEVEVILLSDKVPFYALDSGIKLWQFGSRGSGRRRALYYPRAAWFLRSIVKTQRPDVILSFGELISPFVKLSVVGLHVRTFVFNRGAPERSLRGVSGWLNPLVYPFTDGVVVQTDASYRSLRSRYRFCNFKVIPNPIKQPSTTPNIHDRRKVIVNVGSIGRLKNQEYLLRAFARIDARKDWELHFVGDGPDLVRLEALSNELGLADQVRFLGERQDVTDILADAQVFAFTSLSEGFPNALAEGLAHGCACISFDCPTGPSDLIRHERNGMLVPMGDKRQFEDQLRRLLSDDRLRLRLGQQAALDIQQFSLDKVLNLFEQLISRSGP